MNNFFEPFSSKISLNKNNNMNNSSLNNNNNINYKDYMQLKKEYEKMKNSYEDLLKNIEPKNENSTSKIRRIQDLVDKLKLNENDINEYKNIIKNAIIKLGEQINININNYKEKYTMENKIDFIIQSVTNYINKKDNEIKQLKEEKDILLMSIKTNNLKKELFELLNSKNNNINDEKKKNDLSIYINTIREGYLSKKIDKNNCKIIKGFDYCAYQKNDNNNSIISKENNMNYNNITNTQ